MNQSIKQLLFIGSVSLVVFSCGKGDPEPSAINQAAATGAAITGTVNQSTSACSTNPVQIAVYSEQTVVQHSSINVGSSFTFQVAPGSYTIGAQGTSGCGAQQAVNVTQGQTGSVSLTLVQGGSYTPNGQLPTTGYPNTGYPNTGYPQGYPTTGYPNTGYPNTGYPQGYPPGYPYNQNPNTYGNPYNPFYGLPPIPPAPSWAPGVTYPYIYMYGPQGNGYYYWNYSSYSGPCTLGGGGGWLCSNTF